MNIYLEVYGCTANKSDASLIEGILKNKNHRIVTKVEESDFIIILTCTVIDTTEQRMLSRIKKLKKYDKKMIITGCMASVQKETVKKILPNAKFLKPQYSYKILDLIEDKKIDLIEKNKTLFPKHYNDIIAPISIAEGCNFSCTYCITTIARGKLKSYPINEIKKDMNFAIKKGCKEIQLTAQDTSSYGLDMEKNLGDLLREIKNLKGEYKIRIGMMNPYTCQKNLDSIIQSYNNPHIFKFIHLPVQSGDNEILRKMNRLYNTGNYKKIIQKFRKKYPNITLSTDIIVGFPGETEEQYNNSIKLIKNIKPDITNITRFSARPFTKAKKMKERIKTETVKKRSKKMTDICKKISKDNNLKFIGKEFKILVTKKGKNNTFIGRTNNYKPVVIKNNIKIGSFIDVEIIKAEPNYIVGSIK